MKAKVEQPTDKQVVFLAIFPSIMSAIKVTGDSSGMRITLDIPESEMAQAVKLMLYRQVVLKVTIEPHEQEKPTTDNASSAGNGSRALKRTTAKKRV